MEESVSKTLGNSALTSFKALRVYPLDTCVYLALCSEGPEGLHTLPKSSVTESMVLHPGILWFANKGTPVATCSDSSQAVINQEGARSSGTVAICIRQHRRPA